jgi:septum formation protein
MGPHGDRVRDVLHLASQSPRRRQLLAEAGYAHEAHSPGVDDAELRPPEGLSGLTPSAWTASLAYLKASAGLDRLRAQGRVRAGDVVLGADTVCVGSRADERAMIWSAPFDESQARAMLDQWQGREHEVLTGVALLQVSGDGGELVRRIIFADRGVVRWGVVEPSDLEEYLRSGAWRGKAGGYNLSERRNAGWPITFTGDPAAIMGLPMRALVPVLRSLGVVPGERGR